MNTFFYNQWKALFDYFDFFLEQGINDNQEKVLTQFTNKTVEKRYQDLADTFVGQISESARAMHEIVDSKPFFKAVLASKVTAQAYFQYLHNFYHIYKAREEALERCKDQHEAIKMIYFPAVNRTKELEQDRKFFAHILNINVEKTPLFKATENYVNYLKELEEKEPIKLIAEHYIHVYGGLAGGVIIVQRIKNTPGLFPTSSKETEDGTAFYRYPELRHLTIVWKGETIEKVTAGIFKVYFQSLLNQIRINDQERKQIIVGTNKAFELTSDVLDELTPYL